MKESNFIIAHCECGNADRQKSVLVNRDVKDTVLVKKWTFDFIASLKNRLHDSNCAHSLDVTATDGTAIATNDVQTRN